MAKSFVEEFEVDNSEENYNDLPDYDIFKNKELLDNLRNKIIQNLIDNNSSI